MTLKHSLHFLLCSSLAVVTICFGACRRSTKAPDPLSAEYRAIVSAFYVGLAALQVGDDARANEKLKLTTELAPGEPAAWADWGLLALRRREFDAAAERLEKARSLAPNNGQVYELLGVMESSRGKSAEAIDYLKHAVELNSKDLKALYLLANETERTGGENSDSATQGYFEKIIEVQPYNIAALLEVARIAAKRGDAEVLNKTLARLRERAPSWLTETREQLDAVEAAANGSDLKQAATRVAFLRNVLLREVDYRQSLAAIKTPPELLAEPFTRFVTLESPSSTPALPDDKLNFTAEPISDAGTSKRDWCGAISFSSDGAPTVVCANVREVQIARGATIPFPGGSSLTPPGADSVLGLDYNYDFKTDLALAGAGGFRLFKQGNDGSFTDVTSQTKLPSAVTSASYNGAWAVDIEADGDLDVVLGSLKASPSVLRNNGDETFVEFHPFNGVVGVSGFAWADFDADGDPDAALIDGSGRLRLFSNERQGQFRERPLASGMPPIRAINVADVNHDGVLDLVAVQADGIIIRISDKNDGREWETAEVTRVNNAPNFLEGSFQLLTADLDNNGGLDLVLTDRASTGTEVKNLTGALIWLSDEKGNFNRLLPTTSLPQVTDLADLNSDGRLDLVGASLDGQPTVAINHGSKNYHWQVVRPRASQNIGDQRVNPFGVGGEMEIRSGLFVQKQQINGPLVHFGLGENTNADVVRVVWPNGTFSAEFELKADQSIVTEQRLKASCPFLFAFNGKQMEFVKDAVPWGSAIGLRINTIGSAKIAATGEWYKIGRDQLVPHDGYYDLRITAELWEVYYYDYIALMPVDHPVGTEVFVDERFVVPPAKLGFTTVETPRKIARAIDDNGNDVTEIVSELDGKALDTFGRGQYQGVTRDHYLEVNLGDDAPKSGPLYLIAHGSIHDTESSINVAITQGSRWQAHGMSLEVPDGSGGWVVAQPNLGFPAGRNKTVLFNLTNAFRSGTPRRVRVRTNLEIYWDQIEWARGLPEAPTKSVVLNPSMADLHYRGYSVIHRPDAGAPEVPDYNMLSGTTQIWRDLVGYYTRFGEVGELLDGIDDRYVIVASGDEMALRFAELPSPPEGWVRDFIIIGDGWIKDGDYNSTFSRTVLPLPYHAKQEYTTSPGRLEDEWTYKKYPDDWKNYHTRYVTPEVFRNALRAPKQ